MVFPTFFQAFAFAFILQRVCKWFAYCLCADGKDEFVPFLSSTFVVEHLFIEPAAHGADGACIASQDNGDVGWGNPELDEQTYLVFQF